MLDGADTQSIYYVPSHALFLEWAAMGSVGLAQEPECTWSNLPKGIQSIALRHMGANETALRAGFFSLESGFAPLV